MLHAALTPVAARLAVRFLDEKGNDAFVAVATAMVTEAFGALDATHYVELVMSGTA